VPWLWATRWFDRCLLALSVLYSAAPPARDPNLRRHHHTPPKM